jgi:anti-anti-sigma factor
VSRAQRGRVRVVELEGEIDRLTAPALAGAVRDDGSFDAIVLDLTAVSFVSAAAARLIMSLSRQLSRRGRGVALATVHRHLAPVLELGRFGEAVLVADDAAAAIRMLGERAD